MSNQAGQAFSCGCFVLPDGSRRWCPTCTHAKLGEVAAVQAASGQTGMEYMTAEYHTQKRLAEALAQIKAQLEVELEHVRRERMEALYKLSQVEHEYGLARHRWLLCDMGKLEADNAAQAARIHDLMAAGRAKGEEIRRLKNELAQVRAWNAQGSPASAQAAEAGENVG